MNESTNGQATAVLFSGGLDSVVLLASEACTRQVLPVYVRAGLSWEGAEQTCSAALLARSPFAGCVLPLATLDMPMGDVYPASHWAVAGHAPGYDTDDRDVYLVGRNVTLLAKAGVLCAQLGFGRIVIGPLAGNPFPDATPAFFGTMARTLSLGLAHPIEVDAPFATLRKADVVRLGADLGVPLELTLSCMNPKNDRHCGRCSKCRERRDGFAVAGVPDPTDYAAASPR